MHLIEKSRPKRLVFQMTLLLDHQTILVKVTFRQFANLSLQDGPCRRNKNGER